MEVLCSRPTPAGGLDKVVLLMPDAQGQAQHLLQRFPHGYPSTLVLYPLTWFFPHRLYLGNPMDPPDLLSVELSTSRPIQPLGRVKSKSPQLPSSLTAQGHCLSAQADPEPALLTEMGQGSSRDSCVPDSSWVWGGR